MAGHPITWKIVVMRVAAAFLGIVGAGAGYFWFYHMGPWRRVHDPAWYARQSNAAWWDECQKCIRRSGWPHDTPVGEFGDRQWVEWIMSHIQAGDDITSCRAGHKNSALRKMTNQDVGGSAAAWLAWWDQNKSKSQEEWIYEGFRRYGIELQAPLTQSNIIALLRITAYTDDEKCRVPSYVQYNAFRWLRDSDFDPEAFPVEHLHSKDLGDVFQGLLRFAKRSGMFPKSDGVGVLNLGKPIDDPGPGPPVTSTSFQVAANAIVFVPIAMASLLFWRSFRLRKRE